MKKRIIVISFLIIMILCFSGCSNLEVIQSYIYDDSNYNIGNKAYNVEIEEINIDWIVGDINILPSSNHELIIKEETDIQAEDQYKMHYKLDDKELDIKFAGSTNKFEYSYKVKKLYVYLPQKINKITINNQSSDINVTGVQIEELEINNVNGDLTIEKCKSIDIELNNINGEIIIMDTITGDIEINSDNGDIGLLFKKLPEELDITTQNANITMYVEERDSLAIEFTTISGFFESELNFEQREGIYFFKNSEKIYHITTCTGYLKIISK